ncbi:formin-like protein 5 [Silene latifolia]|uniref:formin-like protein 5 n=1 Tax=Silene latifolia TaxID=37657 RepID=UPI003D76E448
MRRLNSMIIFAFLFNMCFIQNKLVISRMIYMHGVYSPPLQVNKLWDECLRRSSYTNVFKQIETEIGKCGIYLKLVRANLRQTATSPIRLSRKLLFTLPANHEDDVHCFGKYYHLSLQCLHKNAHTNLATLLLHQTSIPRRSLTDKSLIDYNPSSDSVSDDSIIIPPHLLFYPPQATPEVDQSSASSKPTKHQSNNLDKIIILTAASIAGIAMIFSLLVFCSLLRGRRGFRDRPKEDHHLPTLSSSDTSDSSKSSENIDLGKNTTRPQPAGQLGTSLATIPEDCLEDDVNSETQKPQSLSAGLSNGSAPPVPPPAPAFKPKAPPPPVKGARPPPAPPLGVSKQPHKREGSTSGEGSKLPSDKDGSRTKLKPFFWDKVVGNPNHSMVWDEIREGSFQFNEEKIESLFGYNPNEKRNNDRGGQLSDASQPQQIQIIDPKKSQNLSILLRALNVTTTEVCDALLEGNELPTELLHTMMRMAPTQEEELKLRLFDGNLTLLGPAERFLKILVDIPLAFKRMESLMFMTTYKEEVSNIKESFVTFEVASNELKQSRLFLKLLEAVLKTGNRMNDGTYRGGAQAFKLDTLLKLADVKGMDGKTTLLHFVVQEIIRAEGLKAIRSTKENESISSLKSDDFVEDSDIDENAQYQTLGLEIVSQISSELENVKKAAMIDADGLTMSVSKLGQSLKKIINFVNNEMDTSEEETGFYKMLVSFRDHSEGEVQWLVKEEHRISELVRKTADYFHGNAGREEGLRLFSVVRDFLLMLDKICAQLKQSIPKPVRNNDTNDKNTSPEMPSQEKPLSTHDMRQRLFPTIIGSQLSDSGLDSDSN